MRKVSTLLFALAGAALASAQSSSFDFNTEGWGTFQNNGFAPTWISSGGNPGGYISAADSQTFITGYLAAPPSYIGIANLTGGTFSFDLRVSSSSMTSPIVPVRVTIVGGGLILMNVSSMPTFQWVRQTFSFNTTSGWRVAANTTQPYSTADPTPTLAQLNAALNSMTGLYVQCDYNNQSSGQDVTHLDNVRLQPSAAQVVIPVSLQNSVSPLVATRTVRVRIRQGLVDVVPPTSFNMGQASTNLTVNVPINALGPAVVEVDGAQYLRRSTNVVLNGVGLTLPLVTLRPGDVDNNGEVELTDIDLVIADYLTEGGSAEGSITDLDNSGEVELTDIDIVIGNYLLSDE